MPFTKASMVLIQQCENSGVVLVRWRTSSVAPTSSCGAASAVIEKCGHVPAFAFDECGESGFPGHGKVRLEAVAHALELHVIPGHQVEDAEGLLEAGQALDL